MVWVWTRCGCGSGHGARLATERSEVCMEMSGQLEDVEKCRFFHRRKKKHEKAKDSFYGPLPCQHDHLYSTINRTLL